MTETLPINQRPTAATPVTPAENPPSPTAKEDVKKEEEREVAVKGLPLLLTEDGVMATFPDGSRKLISHQDFVKVLYKGVESTGSLKLGKALLLPAGTYAVLRVTGYTYIRMYIPETIQHIVCRGFSGSVVVPNFVIHVKLGLVGDTWTVSQALFRATGKPLGELDPTHCLFNNLSMAGTFRVPFNNFYDNGEMCYGSSSATRNINEEDLRPLYWYYAMIWANRFNDDLTPGNALGASIPEFPEWTDVNRPMTDRPRLDRWLTYLAHCAKNGKGFPYKILN